MKSCVLLCLLAMSLLVFNGCDQEEPMASPHGRVTFSFEKSGEDPGGRTKDLPLPAFASYAIKKSDGSIITDKIEIFEFNGSFVSQPFELSTGQYTLEQFLILDADLQTIYAAPISGSELAHLVEHPLPLSFNISSDQTTVLVPEVLAVSDNSPEDFGYAVFGFEVIEQDLNGLTRFDYAYMPDHPFDDNLKAQLSTFTRMLKNTTGQTTGWNITFKYDGTKERTVYRYNEDGTLAGADQFTFNNGYQKVRSVDFEAYGPEENPAIAHYFTWENNEKVHEYDLHFEYESNRLKTFREDNFKPTGTHYVFINHVFSFDETGNITGHKANGEFITNNSSNGTMHFERLYEYDETANILSNEFDVPKSICFYVLNGFDMWSDDAFPKLLSANNYTKAYRKLEHYEDPNAYDRRRGELNRKLFYNTEGKPASSISEFFYVKPFDPETEIYPMTSSKVFELFNIHE